MTYVTDPEPTTLVRTADVAKSRAEILAAGTPDQIEDVLGLIASELDNESNTAESLRKLAALSAVTLILIKRLNENSTDVDRQLRDHLEQVASYLGGRLLSISEEIGKLATEALVRESTSKLSKQLASIEERLQALALRAPRTPGAPPFSAT